MVGIEKKRKENVLAEGKVTGDEVGGRPEGVHGILFGM